MEYEIDKYFCMAPHSKNRFPNIAEILNYSYSVNKIDIKIFCTK